MAGAMGRPVLLVLGCLCLVVNTSGAPIIQPAYAQGATLPTISELPATPDSHPWLAQAPLPGGYVEQEFELSGMAGLYAPIDLNIARCRMSVAVPAGFDYANAVRQGARLAVATKYVQTAREHFAKKGVHVDRIKL